MNHFKIEDTQSNTEAELIELNKQFNQWLELSTYTTFKSFSENELKRIYIYEKNKFLQIKNYLSTRTEHL